LKGLKARKIIAQGKASLRATPWVNKANSLQAPQGRKKTSNRNANRYISWMPKAQHPKAASFVRQNLFGDVMSFAELEERIAPLPDEQLRGGSVEVFTEAYFATQRKHDAANEHYT
jgi:hypothetical protein